MSKKKYRRKSSKFHPIIPMAVGLLLIVFAYAIMSSPGPDRDEISLSSVVPVSVQFAAPELSLENLNGQTESLTDYRDLVVLVNNWAT